MGPNCSEEHDPFPPSYECRPELYLGRIADEMRSQPECDGLPGFVNSIGTQVIERFRRNLDTAKKRSGAARLSPKGALLAALLALGLPPATAHDWLRGLDADGSRSWHLGYFVLERCWLPGPAPWGKRCKVETAELHRIYLQWCAKNSGRFDGHKPYSVGEFSRQILKCGGVTPWRTKRARGFSGIEPR